MDIYHTIRRIKSIRTLGLTWPQFKNNTKVRIYQNFIKNFNFLFTKRRVSLTAFRLSIIF